MKRFIAVALSAMMILTSFGMVAFAADTTVTFSDVDANTAEGAAIYKLAKAGIVNGNGDGTFAPSSGLTRAELCKMVNLVFGYNEADSVQFNDVTANDWFAPYVLIAKKAGYINGYEDGSFRGNNNITREEFCAILCRVASVFDLGLNAPVSDAVSEWAVPYVNRVVTNSLMTLEDGNKFRATENMKRSEIAVVLATFVKETTTPTVIGGGSIGGSSNKGGSSSGGSTGGGSSSGGSSSGGSSGGSTEPSEPSEPEQPTLTPEEIKAKNDESGVVPKLEKANSELKAHRAEFDSIEQLEIVDDIMDVVAKVIDDAQQNKYVVSDDTIAENYLELIKAARDKYKALDENSQKNFKTKISSIDPDTVDFLETFFNFDVDSI